VRGCALEAASMFSLSCAKVMLKEEERPFVPFGAFDTLSPLCVAEVIAGLGL